MKAKKRELKQVKNAIVKFLKEHRNYYYTAKEISDEMALNRSVVHRALSDLWFSPFNLVRRETIDHDKSILGKDVYTYGF